MTKELELLTNQPGKTIVWVDDRVLLTHDEVNACGHAGATPMDLISLNRRWSTAVLDTEGSVDIVGLDAPFINVAKALLACCKKFQHNLLMMDFRTAHANGHFASQNNLLLLDLHDATKTLGVTYLRDGSSDANWNRELYGAHCVKHYDIKKCRYRFLTRFRAGSADGVAALLPHHFQTDDKMMGHALRVEEEHTDALQAAFEHFLEDNAISECPCVSASLNWFKEAPITGNRNDDHESLEEGDALEFIQRTISQDYLGESAKSILLVPNGGWTCRSGAGYRIAVGDLVASLSSLGVECQTALNPTSEVSLPCQPGLPFVLSVASAHYAMSHKKDYKPPRSVSLSVDASGGNKKTWKMTLLLESVSGDERPITTLQPLRNAMEVVRSGTDPNGRCSRTAQRLVGIEECKVGYRNSREPRFAICDGVTPSCVCVTPVDRPLAIEITWPRDSSEEVV